MKAQADVGRETGHARPLVILKRGRANPVWRGHPWVYSGAVDRVETPDRPSGETVEPGELVDVYDIEHRLIGAGLLAISGADMGTVGQALLAGETERAANAARKLAELFPGRTQPITLEIQHVSWVKAPSPPVEAPAVTPTDAQPIAPPATGAPDTATVAVRPATLHALAVRIRFVRIDTKPSAPVEVTVRISPTTLLLDPAPGGIGP